MYKLMHRVRQVKSSQVVYTFIFAVFFICRLHNIKQIVCRFLNVLFEILTHKAR